MASISLRGLGKRYPDGVVAVEGLMFDIQDKEFLVLTGPKGSGKSTILRMISGMEEISSGELRMDGRPIKAVAPEDRDVAVVLEHPALYPHMTVFDNLAFGLKLRHMPQEEVRRRVHKAADLLELTQLLDRKPKALSAIQRQRVAVGRAVVREPKVYLFDEPLASLEPKLCAQMRAELIRLHQRLDATFVYATSNPQDALRLGGRVVVLKDGVVQQEGTPEMLLEYPRNLFVAGFLGVCPISFLDAKLVPCGDGIALAFGQKGQVYSVKLSPEMAAQVKDFAGKDVIAGIRSIHMCPSPPGGDGVLQTHVESCICIDGEDFLCCGVGGHTLMVKASPQELAEGDPLAVAVDWTQVSLFDRATQLAIVGKRTI